VISASYFVGRHEIRVGELHFGPPDGDALRQSLTWGVELDEGPGKSDTTPFPRENVLMMVYGGCPPSGGAACVT
jgi:hypothetical protein